MDGHRSNGDLHEWRITQLEEAHRSMQEALQCVNITLTDVVTEIRVSKRLITIAVIVVGILQPVVFRYMV